MIFSFHIKLNNYYLLMMKYGSTILFLALIFFFLKEIKNENLQESIVNVIFIFRPIV